MDVVLNSRMVVTVTVRKNRKGDQDERTYDDDNGDNEEVISYPSTVCNCLSYYRCFTLLFLIVCFVFIYTH